MLSSIKESTCITGYIFLSFQNCARYEKGLKNNKHNSLHLTRKYPGIFVLGHYLFLNAHSFVELRSRSTVRFSEQIMSADKYPSIFSRQVEASVYICNGFSVFWLAVFSKTWYKKLSSTPNRTIIESLIKHVRQNSLKKLNIRKNWHWYDTLKYAVRQNACRLSCLITPLYLTLSLALSTNLSNKTLIFHDFQGLTIKLHDLPDLEKEILKFHDSEED